MSSNSSMTGTFKMKLPAELIAALKETPVQTPANDLRVDAMRPSWIERIIEWFSHRR